eukprot:m.433431 g.433431  ORF g.433431 m.433431 type:complete len:285 (-) comp17575_c0_seq1:345-1199(-)
MMAFTSATRGFRPVAQAVGRARVPARALLPPRAPPRSFNWSPRGLHTPSRLRQAAVARGVPLVQSAPWSSYPGGTGIDWLYELGRLKGYVRRSIRLQRINKFGEDHPVLFAGLTTGSRYCIGDAIIQIVQLWHDGEGSWDFQRSLLFSAFGLFYASSIGYTVYNRVYPRLFGAGRPVTTALCDIMTNCPFLYFPMFYVAKAFAFTPVTQWSIRTAEVVKSSHHMWRDNLRGDCMAAAMFWFPVNSVNFRFVPLHLRLPFMSVIGCAWAVVLSSRNGARVDDDDE